MNGTLIGTALVAALVLAAYVLMPPYSNPDYNPAKPHHRPDGFANRHAGRLRARRA